MNPSFLSKSEWRKRLLDARRGMDEQDRRKRDRRIFERLVQSERWHEASGVMAYVSMPGEVETSAILDRAIEEGKRLFLPRCAAGVKSFEVVEVENIAKELETGPFPGLMQPLASLDALPGFSPPKAPFELVLTPGIGFDRSGTRIGFGAGMYDRFFEAWPGVFRLALTYEMQLVDKLPSNDYDRPMHAIVTEERWLDIQSLDGSKDD
ncbi:MAG: 5-formyltetrahydrofolate cyclo-ligase [Candidatus Sumerlaeia bacterium]